MELKAPFPWFGGKSRVAHLVWERFGNLPNYVEPFAGSLAVLLARPHAPGTETVNDRDCYLANFWRAVKEDPIEVAFWADWPVNEADLHARHKWLLERAEFRERMMTDPDYYDTKIAGWWVWGLCQWIGSGWCSLESVTRGAKEQLPSIGDTGRGIHRKRPRPHVSNTGCGIHRKLPHVGGTGRGVHRQLPHLGSAGCGVNRKSLNYGLAEVADGRTLHLLQYFEALSARLREVRVCCGDWTRVLGDSATFKLGVTGVFLDPPYSAEADRYSVYAAEDFSVAHQVREWAIANGNNPMLRIALCGYEGEHQMPDDWECVAWKAVGGYGLQGNGRGRENARRERIWFSPHCLKTTLF